jgi:hypothetical protein
MRIGRAGRKGAPMVDTVSSRLATRLQGRRASAFRSGVYPRRDRLLFDFNERWRREMGRPLVG